MASNKLSALTGDTFTKHKNGSSRIRAILTKTRTCTQKNSKFVKAAMTENYFQKACPVRMTTWLISHAHLGKSKTSSIHINLVTNAPGQRHHCTEKSINVVVCEQTHTLTHEHDIHDEKQNFHKMMDVICTVHKNGSS